MSKFIPYLCLASRFFNRGNFSQKPRETRYGFVRQCPTKFNFSLEIIHIFNTLQTLYETHREQASTQSRAVEEKKPLSEGYFPIFIGKIRRIIRTCGSD